MTPEDIKRWATYLQTNGFSAELLRDLHHSPHRTETLNRTIEYFSGIGSMREENTRYGERLKHVAVEHLRTGQSFHELTAEAVERY